MKIKCEECGAKQQISKKDIKMDKDIQEVNKLSKIKKDKLYKAMKKMENKLRPKYKRSLWKQLIYYDMDEWLQKKIPEYIKLWDEYSELQFGYRSYESYWCCKLCGIRHPIRTK